MKKLFIILISLISSGYMQLNAQTVYEVPFNKKGNIIVLDLQNKTNEILNDIELNVLEKPDWVTIDEIKGAKEVLPGKSIIYEIEFSTRASIKKNKEDKVLIRITSSENNSWEKEILVKQQAPEKFELYQNYPNPFNPSTKISFLLDKESRINLSIYNVLGQKVVTLFKGKLNAGYHEKILNATGFSSGVYYYQIIAENSFGEKKVERKKMILLK